MYVLHFVTGIIYLAKRQAEEKAQNPRRKQLKDIGRLTKGFLICGLICIVKQKIFSQDFLPEFLFLFNNL